MSRWIFLNSGDLASCSANTSMAALKPASITALLKGLSLVPLATRRRSAIGFCMSYLAVMSRAATAPAARTMALFSADSASKAFLLMKNSSSAPPSHQPG
ncbi:hypothetical protein D9M69_522620 [compost metagenome]